MIVETNIGLSGKKISNILKNEKQFLIGRMPGIEAGTITEYLTKDCFSKSIINSIQQNTGFYSDKENFDKNLREWCKIYLNALRDCNLLFRLEFSTWDHLVKDYYENIYVFSCASLQMWLPALENKKILVISPFEKSIKMQYPNRKFLFTTGKQNNFDYPEFELHVLKCPNTIKGNTPFPHKNWLETFEDMCKKINEIDFDIAVLGCGSYGMPLAHHIKKIGKGSIYAGAYTQVMFGIKGKRWDIENNPHRSYWNEYWKWPEDDEIPTNSNKVEGGCYWK
jgi:hypothetical protein